MDVASWSERKMMRELVTSQRPPQAQAFAQLHVSGGQLNRAMRLGQDSILNSWQKWMEKGS